MNKEEQPAFTKSTLDTHAIATRLRRIEGQVQGLQRMLDSGRECEEVLTQVMAVRSSIDQVGLLLMERHIEHCIMEGLPADSPLTKNLGDALKSWARFGLVPGARSDLGSAG
ncbi:MAG: metal-sensitive transcriptional regulator [Dehalococcoidia bacterium]